MAVTKAEKKESIDKLKKIFKDAKSVAFVHFRGLTVGDVEKLRRKLREAGVGYTVAKKTLTRIALDGETIKGTRPEFEGELALAYGEDLIAPAREIYGFEKEFEKRVSIVGGIFDGEYKDKASMTEIASIPSHKTLQGMFVNLINSPIQRFVISLNEIAKAKKA